MPYSRAVWMGASLLLVATAALAAAAADSAQDAPRTPSFHHWPAPPPPADASSQQPAASAVYRPQLIDPCRCLNGGRCHARLRICQCPLGFEGARCERTDTALMEQVEAAAAAAAQQQAEREQQREREAAAAAAGETRVILLRPSLWLFYVPLIGAVALLAAMLRVLGLLGCTMLMEARKKHPQLPTFHAYDNVARPGCIYTLPLQPPPYSEKVVAAAIAAATAAPLAHSTPCCTLQHAQLAPRCCTLQQLQPEKLQ